MTALRFPAGGNLWRTQSDYPWSVRRNGGMIESLKVGLSEGGGERLSRSYAYNSFSDITALTEDTTSYSFAYDGLGRLTNAYGRSYLAMQPRLTVRTTPVRHAADRIGNADRFDYDANGNMTCATRG